MHKEQKIKCRTLLTKRGFRANNKHELSDLYKAMVALNIRAAKQKEQFLKMKTPVMSKAN